jgi:putative transcriptional regulator
MHNNLTGYLLIAPPSVMDRRFTNTVIYVTSHTASGAWGLALNKPIDNVSIQNIMDRLHYPVTLEGVVHAGGPVDHTVIHFLHTNDIVTSDTVMDNNGVCTSGNIEFVDLLMQGQVPEKARVFLGACTWAPGQIEEEMLGNIHNSAWLVVEANPEIVFEYDGLEQWHKAVELAASMAVKDWMR